MKGMGSEGGKSQTVEWLEIVSSIINNHGITRKDMICFQKWVVINYVPPLAPDVAKIRLICVQSLLFVADKCKQMVWES